MVCLGIVRDSLPFRSLHTLWLEGDGDIGKGT